MVFGFVKNKILGQQSKSLQVGRNFSVPMDAFSATGERDAILASSGMGKSYLAGVIAEETLENGSLLCVIDPEGEYFTLAERYPILIVGGEQGMLPISEEAIDLYVEMMLEANVSLVFDLSDYIDTEQQQLYAKIADSIFSLETKYRKKVRIIIEEAQIYAPQRMAGGQTKGGKPKLDPVYVSQKLAKRGRKRAIDTMWATQRPASLSKDILSQCNRFWFGGISAEQDYKAIRPFLNEAGISFQQIKNLRPGEFFFYSKGSPTLVRVRKRYCKHAGATPEAQRTFAAISNAQLDQAIQALGQQISQRQAEHREEQSEIRKLKQYIRTIEKQMESLQDELEQERTATKVLSRLGISKDNESEVAPRPRRRVLKSSGASKLAAIDDFEEDL